jgi:hypothetical protein
MAVFVHHARVACCTDVRDTLLPHRSKPSEMSQLGSQEC